MLYVISVLFFNLLALFTTVTYCEKKPIYHVLSKTVFEPGTSLGPKDALFGYSITYQTQRKKIIIGAPRAETQGEVFECDIMADKGCSKIYINLPNLIKPGATQEELKKITPYWLGAAVGAGSDFFVTCAPHYTNYAVRENRYRTTSRCFYQSATSGRVQYTKELQDKKKADSNKSFYNQSQIAWEKRFDTMGWSMDVGKDDVTIVGGPGAAMGRAMIIPKNKAKDVQLLDLKRNFSDPDGLVLYDFGYSVKAGRFLGSQGYAISSPYGAMGKGKVLFYSKSLEYMQSIVDDEVGSIFGGALCSARLSAGDNEALLVGAPASAHRGSDELDVGAVHIYIKEAAKLRWKRTLRGYQNNGYFGYTIASVGDLNLDGKDEVVISAPYENDYCGAVYIFSGADLFKDATSKVQWLQRIEGDAPGQMLGIGLSPVQDLDNNGCNELSIGLPGNNRAILMKCIAFVTFTLSFNESLDYNDIKSDNTSVFTNTSLCVKIANNEKLKNIENNIAVIIKLKHPNATLVDSENNTLSYNVSISNGKSDCHQLEIKMPLNGNYEKEMVLQANASLSGQDPSNLTEYKYGLVMLTDETQTYLEKKISIASLNLTLNLSTSFNHAKDYIIGSKKNENLTIEVSNAPSSRGGVYDACVRVRIRGVKVTRTSTNCAPAPALAGYTYTCVPSEPILAGKSMISTMILNTESLIGEEESIEIEAKLFKLCDDSQPLVNQTMPISIQRDVNITVTGESIPSAVVNVSEAELVFGYEDIRHVYSIINAGVMSRGGIQCTISIPQHVNYSISTDSLRHECRQDQDKAIATCIFKKIATNTKRDIKILMNILPNTPFTEKLHREITKLETEISCEIADEKRTKRISTMLNLWHTTVPLWIIILAVAIGLLVLLIMTVVLYECGFLRRKHKEELVALRKDVTRPSNRLSIHVPFIEQPDDQHLVSNIEADEIDVITVDVTDTVHYRPSSIRVTADHHRDF